MKNLKEFLEKRWWQGVGGIAALIAIVIAILQWQGIVSISWLAVSIMVNIMLAVALAVVAVLARRWKRRGEQLSSRIGEIEGLVERQKEARKRKRVLLPDPNCTWKLSVDNALLNELYGQAYGLAVNKYHDAKLSGLGILVSPYRHDRVSILFDFYSRWARRECTFFISEILDMTESVPSKPKAAGATFEELPWIRDPNWQQFLKKSCEKAGPLSPAFNTGYILSADAGEGPQWWISFTDGVTGKECRFDWDGKGEPMPWEKFG
jgi:hypothetical protein